MYDVWDDAELVGRLTAAEQEHAESRARRRSAAGLERQRLRRHMGALRKRIQSMSRALSERFA